MAQIRHESDTPRTDAATDKYVFEGAAVVIWLARKLERENAALVAALEKEQEWRERDAAGELDPDWDYETMVGQYRKAALALAKG